MKAGNILQIILAQGIALQDAVVKQMQTSGGKFDALAFLASPEWAGVAGSVQDLLDATSKPKMDEAIAETDAKMAAILGGRSVIDLDGDELINYSALANAKLQFAGIGVRNAMDAELVDYLVTNALPTLTKVAPMVLPLLL